MNKLTLSSNKKVVKITTAPGVNLKFKRGVTLTFIRGIRGPAGADGAGTTPSPVSVTNGTTYAIPAGRKLDSISVIPTAGARTLTVGYSSGTGEIIDAETIDSNDGASFQIGRYFHAGKTLHFSGFTGSVLIYLL